MFVGLVVVLSFLGTSSFDDEHQFLAGWGDAFCGGHEVHQHALGEVLCLEIVQENEQFALIRPSNAGDRLGNKVVESGQTLAEVGDQKSLIVVSSQNL